MCCIYVAYAEKAVLMLCCRLMIMNSVPCKSTPIITIIVPCQSIKKVRMQHWYFAVSFIELFSYYVAVECIEKNAEFGGF